MAVRRDRAGLTRKPLGPAPGTVFHLTVEVDAAAAPIQSYAWQVNGVPWNAQGSAIELAFDHPGDVAVDVVVTDQNGGSATDGLLLKVFDPAGQPVSRTATIAPTSGMPGTAVQLQSNALNAAGVLATVKIGNGIPFEPYRPELGVANFQIPSEAADGLQGATPTTITLLIDGQTAATFPFTLSPTPASPDPPGTIVTSFLTTGPSAVADAEADLVDILATLEPRLPVEQRVLLLALLRFARDRFAQVRDQLLPILGTLDAQSLTLLDQGLLANGVGGDVKATFLRTPARPGARNADDTLIDRLCLFHARLRELRRAVDANDWAALYNSYYYRARETLSRAPVARSILSLATDLGVMSDLFAELDAMVPEVRDELQVTATPGFLETESERAVVRIRALLSPREDVCGRTNVQVYKELADRAAERLTSVPTFSGLARAILDSTFYVPYGSRDSSEQFESIGGLLSYVRQVLQDFTFIVVQGPGLDALLDLIRGRLCQVNQSAGLLLEPQSALLSLDPVGSGSFENPREESIDFACAHGTNATVTLKVDRPCGAAIAGGAQQLHGETDIGCGAENCAEDASAAIQTIVTEKQFLDGGTHVCENTPFPSFPVVTRTAAVRYKNVHPSRTVAVSFVVVDHANAAAFDNPPCSGSQCDNVLGRCFVFLQPGETSPEIVYNCDVSSVSSLQNGSNPCVSGHVESDGETIAQAAFCTYDSPGKNVFCEDAGRFLQEHEAAHASFTGIEAACPAP